MKKKMILSIAFLISLLPMLFNQYGGLKGVQEITGLINLLNPIGMVSVILFVFCETAGEEHQDGIFAIDGTVIPGKALHPVAMTAVNAQAGLLVQNEHALACVRKFWNTPLRTGNRRYYDNCLYFFAFLALSGNYRIY